MHLSFVACKTAAWLLGLFVVLLVCFFRRMLCRLVGMISLDVEVCLALLYIGFKNLSMQCVRVAFFWKKNTPYLLFKHAS